MQPFLAAADGVCDPMFLRIFYSFCMPVLTFHFCHVILNHPGNMYFHFRYLNYTIIHTIICFFSDCQRFVHCSRGHQLHNNFYHHYHDYCSSIIRYNLDKHFFGADRRRRHGRFHFDYNWIPTYTLHFIQRGWQRCGIQTSFRQPTFWSTTVLVRHIQ